MKPLVSVVIPTYNRANDLRRAVQSVIAQTCDRWELLVVDNHSTDDTDEVVASFDDSRVRLMKVRNNGVIAVSRNVGIREAAGEYVALLDSDDWWTPRKLELSVSALDAGADIAYHDLLLARSASQRLYWARMRTRQLQAPVYDDLLQNGNAINTSSVVVRRESFARIEGFSEDSALVSWEDFDAWLRLATTTERFCRLKGAWGYYWVGGGNMSSPARTIRNLELIRDRYIRSAPHRAGADMPGWYHYALGRAYYHLQNYSTSLHHLRRALRGNLSARARMKALLTIAAGAGRAARGSA